MDVDPAVEDRPPVQPAGRGRGAGPAAPGLSRAAETALSKRLPNSSGRTGHAAGDGGAP